MADQGTWTLGIVGGTGWLGGAIATRLLTRRFLTPQRLWLSNRSGAHGAFAAWRGTTVTTDNAALVEASDVVMLAVRPGDFAAVRIDASDKLVVSVMASVPVARIAELTGASRIVRAMPNPSVEFGEGFTPWYATRETSLRDRALVSAIFDTCGPTEELASEDHIDYFTGLTGPVPGFLGYVADAMIQAAVDHGIERGLAERAVRHHCVAAAHEIDRAPYDPAQMVKMTLDYGGTTAAGFRAADAAGARKAIAAGLRAAWEVARKDRSKD